MSIVPTARIEQAIETAELPSLHCADCHVAISDGCPVTVLACRDAPDDCWRIDRVWDAACAEYELHNLDLDVEGPRALLEGDVVTVMDGVNQTHWPALVRADLVDHAGVTEVRA